MPVVRADEGDEAAVGARGRAERVRIFLVDPGGAKAAPAVVSEIPQLPDRKLRAQLEEAAEDVILGLCVVAQRDPGSFELLGEHLGPVRARDEFDQALAGSFQG